MSTSNPPTNTQNQTDQLENRVDYDVNSSTTNYKHIFVLILVILLILFFGFMSYIKHHDKSNTTEEKKQDTEITVKSKEFSLPLPKLPPKTAVPSPLSDQIITPSSQTALTPQIIEKPALVVSKSTSKMMIKNINSSSNIKSLTPKMNIDEKRNDGLGKSITGDLYNGGNSFKPTAASLLQFDPNLLLSKGTYITCNLRNRFVSNVSGQMSCVIADDVFSANGQVVLIEKGSIVFGVYNGGNVSSGSNEMFVIWQQIRTPKNIVVNIDSGSTDELGAAGMPGYLETHFWRRFSNAIMVSSMTDLIAAGSSRLSKNGNNNYLNDTTTNSESLVRSIIDQDRISPTLIKNQGDKIGILVARDIDFSTVYDLKDTSK